jgi:hypothetical protein
MIDQFLLSLSTKSDAFVLDLHTTPSYRGGVNAIFNNISVISWWSVLLVEETAVPEENHRPAASH